MYEYIYILQMVVYGAHETLLYLKNTMSMSIAIF